MGAGREAVALRLLRDALKQLRLATSAGCLPPSLSLSPLSLGLQGHYQDDNVVALPEMGESRKWHVASGRLQVRASLAAGQRMGWG